MVCVRAGDWIPTPPFFPLDVIWTITMGSRVTARALAGYCFFCNTTSSLHHIIEQQFRRLSMEDALKHKYFRDDPKPTLEALMPRFGERPIQVNVRGHPRMFFRKFVSMLLLALLLSPGNPPPPSNTHSHICHFHAPMAAVGPAAIT